MTLNSSTQGVLFAISAYTMWGVAPIYFKLLTDIPAGDILSHRVIWSSLLISLLLLFRQQWHKVLSVLKQPRYLLTLCATSVLIGINWLIFIWAVNNNRLLDASLGYFINPLVNVILAVVFLHERFRSLQWLAVALAAIGVSIQVINYGAVPWAAIALALSFGLYGLLRKKVDLDALPGLFIETAILMPLAFLYMVNSPGNYMHENGLILASSGIVTTLPLLAFCAAAVRLKLSTLSFFQYIGPSLMFLLATLAYGETLDTTKVFVFLFIWSALIVFSWESFYVNKRRKRTLADNASEPAHRSQHCTRKSPA